MTVASKPKIKYIKTYCTFLKDCYFVRIRFTGSSPTNKDIEVKQGVISVL